MEKDKKSFYESNHLNGDVDFVKLIKMILKEEKEEVKAKRLIFQCDQIMGIVYSTIKIKKDLILVIQQLED